jgi:hypothetical protein
VGEIEAMTLKQNIIKLVHGGFIDLDARVAKMNLQVPFAASLAVPPPSPEVLSAMASFAAGPRSLQVGDAGSINPGLTQADVFPNEQTDYIFPKFRALSAVLIPGYWIDFSVGSVLRDSMPLLAEQTLYCDHVYWRTREWVGVVNQVLWDEKPDKAGAPGINTQMKVDWRKAPDIARGLLMKPPAVRAVSATVDFDWDASHPDLLEKRIFYQSLGENIDGQIVRLLVTKITDYYEVSFVYKGANPGSNGQLPADDEDENEFSAPGLSHRGTETQRQPLQIATTKEKHTVKLTAAQKTALGITHEGEEVPDADVISTATSLAQRATSADAIVAAQRAEVLRLATLAEGVGEGDARKLDPAIAGLIEKADVSQLPGLATMYGAKAQSAFPLTCQKCGSKEVKGRSSVEDPAVVEEKGAPVRDSGLL